MNDSKPRYLTQSALTRRLGCAPSTLRARILSGAIVPDGEVVTGAHRNVLFVFDEARLPELERALIANTPAVR